MRRLVLITVLMLASASAFAGDSRSLSLTARSSMCRRAIAARAA